ncbi:MAG: response regulator [Polyangiaceae bacterium]|jgi:DNA-binding response OmpR family regulator
MKSALRTVLVVEDDPALQVNMTRHLSGCGFSVLAAADYHGALAHVQSSPLHVVYVDLGLPNESGYELCERIRLERHQRFVPIVVTGERGFPEDMARAEEAGANAFLRKPFSMRLLTESLQMLLEGGSGESRPPIRRLRAQS